MSNCVLYLPFWVYGYECQTIGGTAGYAWDQSGQNNHGRVAAFVAARPVPGPSRIGWYFDGSSAYVNVPDATTLDVQSFTLLAWLYPTSLASGQHVIASKWSTASNQTFLLDFSTANLRLLLSSDGTTNAAIVTATSASTVNTWVNHAVVYNATASTVTMYKDGAVWASSTTTGTVPSSIKVGTSPVRIAATTVANFAGYIGEIFFSSSAFTLAEIGSYYELTRSKYMMGV